MPERKLTDEEVIKALEHAMYSAKGEDGFKELHWEMLKDFLDLINRQKAKIEELRKGFKADADYFANEYDSYIRADAIREFAKRLKKKIFPFPFAKISEIDNLVKEMTEDKQ